MRLTLHLPLIGCIFSMLVTPSIALAGDNAAEFAIRWNPEDGGPQTPKEVVKLLNLPADDVDKDDYAVSYFSIDKPVDVPTGYSVIARQRIKGKKTQLMIKYRGDQPLPNTYTSKSWECPLGSEAEAKYEVDVTLLADQKTKKAFSLSCSLESKEAISFPNSLNATQRGSVTTMVRYSAKGVKKGIKIEEWTFKPCGEKMEEKMLEVSKPGVDNEADLAAFTTEIAAKLLLSGIVPLDSSKSVTGADSKK